MLTQIVKEMPFMKIIRLTKFAKHNKVAFQVTISHPPHIFVKPCFETTICPSNSQICIPPYGGDERMMGEGVMPNMVVGFLPNVNSTFEKSVF